MKYFQTHLKTFFIGLHRSTSQCWHKKGFNSIVLLQNYCPISVTCDRSVVFFGYSGFLHQLNRPPRYNWNIVESGIKHHNPYPNLLFIFLWINQIHLADSSCVSKLNILQIIAFGRNFICKNFFFICKWATSWTWLQIMMDSG